MKTKSKYEVIERISQRSLVLAALLAAGFICASVGHAQSSATPPPGPAATPAAAGNATPTPVPAVNTVPVTQAATPKPAAAPVNALASPAAQSSSKGSHEGIAAHGHWTIEVRNPDGKVAKHLEFENTLCTTFVDPMSGVTVLGGDSTLTSLLAGISIDPTNVVVPGAWSIILGAPEPAIRVTLPDGTAGLIPPPNCAFTTEFALAQNGVQGGSSFLASKGASDYVPFALLCSGNCFPVVAVSSSLTSVGATPSMSLSGQFTVPPGNPVLISAVGTDLFTCLNSSVTVFGPQSCENIGNMLAGACNLNVKVFFTEVIAGTTYETPLVCGEDVGLISIQTYPVGGQTGRAPFSGVVLGANGVPANGVPGSFTVSAGQIVAVNWTLSFQ
jgi:hypothetical protein